jgi:hypothetical protein
MGIPSGSSEHMIAGQLVRSRYFPRQLVTAADLNADQTYFRELVRRHNRYLHGCGVVCGLEVLLDEDDEGHPQIVVTLGHAISPQGDDIHVPEQQSIPMDDIDECIGPGQEQRLYIVLRYVETPLCPVPTLPGPCTPTAGQQFSRLQADFELVCMAELPLGCGEAPPCGDLTCELLRDAPPQESQCAIAACPSYGADPWVVLAALDLDANGAVSAIDYGVRRRVLSVQFLVEALRCLLPRITAISPSSGTQGTRMLALVFGERLMDTHTVRFEDTSISTHIVSQSLDGHWVLIQMDIGDDAALGPQGFQVITPRGVANSAACDVQFTVLPRLVGYGYGYGYLPYGARDQTTPGIGGNLL